MAAHELGSLFVRFGADVKDLWTQVNKIDGGLKAVGEKMQSAGRAMTVGITAPLVAIGVGAAKAVAGFDKAMTTSLAAGGRRFIKHLP